MNLSNRSELKRFLDQFGLKPQKGLGQHFLCSEAAVNSILNACNGAGSILEIGPGPGILTQKLAEVSTHVLAIEIDEKVLAALHESSPFAKVLVGDALKMDWNSLLDSMPKPRYIVSNMPYYISGSLFQKLIESHDCIDGAILMMQLEVGHRVVAPTKSRLRSSLSVHLQALFDMKVVSEIEPSAFLPPPKVKSIIIKFIPKKCILPRDFFEFVRNGFQQPRKTLVNNLLKVATRESIELALEKLSLSKTIRAQFLSEDEWFKLYFNLKLPFEHQGL